MSNDNQKLLRIIRRMTNLVLLLIGLNIALPILIVNADDIAKKFESLGERAEVTPYVGSNDDGLLSKARKTFTSITFVSGAPQRKSLIALGKELYFEKQLSLEGNISCNSCHNLDTYGVDNLPTSPGDEGELGARNSPTTIYAALHSSQFWDGRAKDVEEQSGMPILNPVEHNIPSKSFLENRLRNINKYQTMFAKAFPEMDQPITYDNLQEAIGAFERQLIPKSKFDKWLDGDEDALNSTQKEGLRLFINNKCTTCHNGVAVGGTMLQKFGAYDDYWVHTQSEQIDEGLFEQTGNENDKYMFKVPGLRNIAKTAPYFHDGSVDDLSRAVEIMSRVQLNKKLQEEETKKIVAFLESLTADVDQEYKK